MSSSSINKITEAAWKATGNVFREDLPIFDNFDGSIIRRASDHGYIGIIPLWSGLYTTAGLRVVPGTAVERWPGILVSNNGFSLTIATSAKSLLPRWALHEISLYPGIIDRVEARSSEFFELGRDLHLALGGDEATWRIFVDSFREASTSLRRQRAEPAFERACSALARRMDDSDEFRAFADWMDAALDGEPSVPAIDRMGCWDRLAAILTWLLANEEMPRSKALTDAVGRVIAENAGIDTSVSLPLSWGVRPGPTSAEATLARLARSLAMIAFDDPLTQVLAERLRTDGVTYTGLTHAEAVPLLDERGEPGRAWEVLCSAAWWMARNLGEPSPAIFEGGRLLCDRHGWDDARWVVDRMAGEAR